MPEAPDVGDKVSWNWGGGAPGGKVAEVKEKGEVAITSKRGNKIKKNAEPENPAVHVERSGNDVVKKASELNIEQKGSGGSKGGSKSEDKKGEKRKHEDDEKGDPHVKNKDGKEVKPGGKEANKKQKQEKEEKEEDAEKQETKKDNKQDAKQGAKQDGKQDSKQDEKKKPGRPKKGEGEAKTKKKEPTPRPSGDTVSSRTRSQGK